MKKRKFILLSCLLASCSTYAQNWASTLTNRGTLAEYREVSEIGEWCVRAVSNRFPMVTHDSFDELIFQWGFPSASQAQQPFVEFVKPYVKDMITNFVDMSYASSGNFNNWFSTPSSTDFYSGVLYFPTTFPMLSVSQVLARANAPTNFFNYTPWRPLTDAGGAMGQTNSSALPGYTTLDYGWEALSNILVQLQAIPKTASITGTVTETDTAVQGSETDNNDLFYGTDSSCNPFSSPETFYTNKVITLTTTTFAVSGTLPAQWETWKVEEQKNASGSEITSGTHCGGSCDSELYWTEDDYQMYETELKISSTGIGKFQRSSEDLHLAGTADWYVVRVGGQYNNFYAYASATVEFCTDPGDVQSATNWYSPPQHSAQDVTGYYEHSTTFEATTSVITSSLISVSYETPITAIATVSVTATYAETCGEPDCETDASAVNNKSQTVTYGNFEVGYNPIVLLKYNFDE